MCYSGPSSNRTPEPDHRYNFSRFFVPEDTLETADGARAAEGPGCEAARELGVRYGGVGFVGGPLGVCGEGLHDWEFFGLFLEVFDHEGILF